MLSIIENAKNELVEKPISTLGAVAAVAALLIKAPEIVLMNPSPQADTIVGYGKQGLVTWLLLYAATCFLFGKFGSMVARRNAASGTLIYPVLGIITVFIGVYLASVYLSSFPLTVREDSSGRIHEWFGIQLPFVGALMGLIWTTLAIATYWPDKDYEPSYREMDESAVQVFGFFGVVIVMMVLSSLAYALILGVVPIITPSE